MPNLHAHFIPLPASDVIIQNCFHISDKIWMWMIIFLCWTSIRKTGLQNWRFTYLISNIDFSKFLSGQSFPCKLQQDMMPMMEMTGSGNVSKFLSFHPSCSSWIPCDPYIGLGWLNNNITFLLFIYCSTMNDTFHGALFERYLQIPWQRIYAHFYSPNVTFTSGLRNV